MRKLLRSPKKEKSKPERTKTKKERDRERRTFIGSTLDKLKRRGINEFIRLDLKNGTEETLIFERALQKNQDMFDKFQGWLNQLLYDLERMKTKGKIKTMPTEDVDAALKTLRSAVRKICSDYNPSSPICTRVRASSDRRETKEVSAALKSRRRRSMMDVWRESCSKDEHSLLCEAGKGNQLANFILRMKFIVPPDPNKNALRALYDMVNNVPLVGRALTEIPFLKKIERNEPIEWSDLNSLAAVIQKVPGGKAAVNNILVKYGLETEDVKGVSSGSSVSEGHEDLEMLWRLKCEQEGEWQGTLFCDMAYEDSVAAQMIGDLRFVAPLRDPNNHIVLKVMGLIIQALQKPDPQTGSQTWGHWGVEKALEYSLSDLKSRIQNNEPISWADLNKLYAMANFPFSKIPLVGSRIQKALEGEDLHALVENAANEALNKRGIAFVTRKRNGDTQ